MSPFATSWPIPHPEFLRAMVPVAHAAGALQMKVRSRGASVERKADKSPVTEADRESEALILAAMAKAWAWLPVISEEQAADGKVPEVGATFGLLDPLDGTQEFVAGLDDFGVNIAIVHGGRARLGLIYAPARGEIMATLGDNEAGAARLDPADEAAAGALAGGRGWRPVKARGKPAEGGVAMVSRFHPSKRVEALFDSRGIRGRLICGASLKFCHIARGEADIYARLSPLLAWDAAAGHAIIEAAGGRMTDPEGRPIVYGAPPDPTKIPGFIATGVPD